MSTRGRRALRAGLTATLAFVLTSALFSAPLLATQHDFGHTHPEGTPHHVHALDAVLGSSVVSTPQGVPFQLNVGRAPRLPRTPPPPISHNAPHDSRAPPTA